MCKIDSIFFWLEVKQQYEKNNILNSNVKYICNNSDSFREEYCNDMFLEKFKDNARKFISIYEYPFVVSDYYSSLFINAYPSDFLKNEVRIKYIEWNIERLQNNISNNG